MFGIGIAMEGFIFGKVNALLRLFFMDGGL